MRFRTNREDLTPSAKNGLDIMETLNEIIEAPFGRVFVSHWILSACEQGLITRWEATDCYRALRALEE